MWYVLYMKMEEHFFVIKNISGKTHQHTYQRKEETEMEFIFNLKIISQSFGL